MAQGDIKWYNTIEIVDIETGEIISKSRFERENYRIVKKSKSYEFKKSTHGEYGIATNWWECKPNEQQRIEFGTS